MVEQHPELLWAQRSSEYEPEKNVVFLTVNVSELDPSYELKVDGDHISFKGKVRHPQTSNASAGTASAVESKEYAFDLDLFAKASETKRHLTGKSLQIVLRKDEAKAEYWPRLTKDKGKNRFIKTDFTLWRDEDEQDDEEEASPAGMDAFGGGGPGAGGMDMASMLGGMGGAGAMGGMGGMGGGQPDFEAMMKQMQAQGINMGGEDEDDATAAPTSDANQQQGDEEAKESEMNKID